MQITKTDVYWNYGAAFLKIASSALLLPLILRMMPSETVGIWSIFMTITAFATVLDFGFNPSFTRNITYVFSGVKSLKVNGFETGITDSQIIDYGLLKGVISAMRYLYLRMAIVLFLLLSTLGTYYIYTLLQKYKGDHQEIYIAWILLCAISTYNLFTLYYDSLLQGKGLVKKSKQIVIIGQAVYLVIASLLIITGNGLVALVSAQVFSVIIIRWLSYRSFFTNEITDKLLSAITKSRKEVLKTIYPNALRIGLTTLGGIVVQRSAIIYGSFYIGLDYIASYGITIQIIYIIANMSGIYIATYQPKLTQWQIVNDHSAIKTHYLIGQLIMLFTYVIGGASLLILGPWALNFIGSRTHFMPSAIIIVAIIISFLDNIQYNACIILLSKNVVPFFKSSLYTGAFSVLLLFIFFQYTKIGLWAMIAAPGIAQGLYQNWKWPVVVIKELNITFLDVLKVIRIININKILKYE